MHCSLILESIVITKLKCIDIFLLHSAKIGVLTQNLNSGHFKIFDYLNTIEMHKDCQKPWVSKQSLVWRKHIKIKNERLFKKSGEMDGFQVILAMKSVSKSNESIKCWSAQLNWREQRIQIPMTPLNCYANSSWWTFPFCGWVSGIK